MFFVVAQRNNPIHGVVTVTDSLWDKKENAQKRVEELLKEDFTHAYIVEE